MLLRSILFTGAVQGLFQILLLRSKNRNQQADYWLMLWLLLVSMQLFFYFENLSGDPMSEGITGIFAFSIPLLSAPVLFEYICSISFGKNVNYRRLIVYFGPWLIYIIATVGLKLRGPSDIFILSGYPHFSDTIAASVVYLFTFPMAIIPGIYAIMGFNVLLRYQKSLPHRFSYTEHINLNWLKWLVFSILILFVLLFLFIRISTQTHLVSADSVFLYVGVILSVYVFLIGYFGLRQSTLMMSAQMDIDAKHPEVIVSYKKSGLDDSTVEQIYQRLLIHMETTKPYLQDDLSLSLLADQLALNPNQLSQVVNQKSGGNFFVFVNAYRVEEVKAKLVDPSFSHLSILGIAYACGFRSKSAFNRIFKAQAGISPKEYQRKK
jgi:AraC-like DNA-binding protein